MPAVFHLLAPLFGAVAPAVDIPIWNQYVHLLENVLGWLGTFFHSGGVAIIAFTVIVKTMLLPLTVQATRSSKAMQELQPKIKELQKRHGKDRQRLTQETMALYQQYHVNPMAGCLPMILQIPIFLGVYHAILNLSRSNVGVWDAPFLWIPDLSAPDPIHLLPIMMRPAGQGKSSDPQQAMMNQLMNFMPLTVILFGWNFAAGPVIYWATQSMYSVVQQWIITGWGSMKDWVPGLPELPEHRRLGYRAPRNLDDVVVLGGDGGQPVKAKGISGWLQAQMDKANAMSVSATAPPPPRDEPEEAETGPAKGGAAAGAKGGKGKAQVTQRGQKSSAADGDANGAAPSASASANGKAVIVPRKSRPAGD